MSKTVLIVIAVVATGGLAYMLFRRGQDGVPVIAGPNQIGSPVNPALLTQPSQVYPVQPPAPVRQDTASQPWYGGPRPATPDSSLVDQNMLKNAQTLQGAASVVDSVKSIWDDLDVSSWWSEDSMSSISEDDMFLSNDFSWEW